MKTKQESIN